MPARKNRPGKSGTRPLSDILKADDERAMEGLRKAKAHGVAYWPPDDGTETACHRLMSSGLVKRMGVAFTLV